MVIPVSLQSMHFISHIGFGNWCIPFLGFSSSGQIVANVLTSSTTIVSATNGLRLYINGYSSVNVSNATNYWASGVQNYLTLGTVLSGTSCLAGSIQNTGQYIGAIDEFYLYSRELSASEVCQLASL
jgi:uncharacterized protein YcsI (UPF0317 family)